MAPMHPEQVAATEPLLGSASAASATSDNEGDEERGANSRTPTAPTAGWNPIPQNLNPKP